MQLSIIITSYKARVSLVKTCINSIRESLRNKNYNYEIIHIDNVSSEKMLAFARDYKNGIRFITNKNNIGFSRMCNIGFKVARGKYILLLNDDIIIVKDAIIAMMQYLKYHPKVGIVGPMLLNFNGAIQNNTWKTPSLKYLLSSRLPLMNKLKEEYTLKRWDRKDLRKVGWLLGAAIMVRKKDLANIGLMDNKIFMYFEDSDLCRRFWISGFEVMFFPEAKMYHFHGRPSAQGGLLRNIFWFFDFQKRVHFRSMIYYLRKYWGQKKPEEQYGF